MYNFEQTFPCHWQHDGEIYIFCFRLQDACCESWKTANKCQGVGSKLSKWFWSLRDPHDLVFFTAGVQGVSITGMAPFQNVFMGGKE